MSELIHQLGIDWKLLLSQAVNFLILLVVLRAFVYQPIVKILKERQRRIKEGLEKAAEADIRLQEVGVIAKSKLKDAEREALEILRQTEAKARETEAKLLEAAKEKESELFAQANLAIEGKKKDATASFRKEAAAIVKAAIAKTVELSPDAIDEALIRKAVEQTNPSR